MLKWFYCSTLTSCFSCWYCGKLWFHENECNWEQSVLNNNKKYFYSPTERNFESKYFIPVCQLKLKHFLSNWHFSCKCQFNGIFKMKWQFWIETVWYESIFVSNAKMRFCSKCQNMSYYKSRSDLQELFFLLYTHTHIQDI